MIEPIDVLNARLIDYYGITVDSGLPVYRIVHSDEILEKRRMKHTEEGIELPFGEIVREVPKYRQWIQNRYILEQLQVVTGETDLTTPISYEPIWVFQNEAKQPVPPMWEAIQFIITTMMSARGKSDMAKYIDPAIDPDFQEKRIQSVYDGLFGDKTPVADALSLGEGIVVPSNFKES